MDKDKTPPKFETLQEEPAHIPDKPVDQITPSHPFPKYIPKKIALILIIIILSVFLIGGIYELINLNSDQTSERISNTPTIITTPTIEPISDWKTYEDSVLTFKYPPSHPIEVENKVIYVNKDNYFPVSIFARYDGEEFLENCKNDSSKTPCIGRPDIEAKQVTINGKAGTEIKFVAEGSAWIFHTIQFEDDKLVLYPDHKDFDLIIPTLNFK